jgi:uncharacterized membrane protein YjjP (DUF1212 family)
MKTKELMKIALQAGETLLVSGAEIYRVEETILRIFRFYNKECECFVLLTGIFISVEDEDSNTISFIKRIKGNSFDLHRIELVNSFSRNLQKNHLTYSEAKEILDSIAKTPRFKFVTRLISAGMTSFVYALLFRGSFADSIAAFLISIFIYSAKEKISEIGFFLFFEYFVSGLLVGFLSLVSVKIYHDLNIYKVIIGSVMILVPGVAITNGLKDALYGDTVSSLYRIAEAVFIATAVSAGVGIVLAYLKPF